MTILKTAVLRVMGTLLKIVMAYCESCDIKKTGAQYLCLFVFFNSVMQITPAHIRDLLFHRWREDLDNVAA